MALIIEDGTGVADADSYLAIDDADFAAFGHTAWALETVDAVKEVALRQATEYLDATYSFKGTPSNGEQGLSWPRSGVEVGTKTYGSASVPREVKRACMFIAVDYLVNGDPDAIVDPTTQIKRFKSKIDGVNEKETEYRETVSTLRRYPRVEKLLANLTTGGPGNHTVQLVRS